MGYNSNVSSHVCGVAEHNLRNQFALVMTAERLPEGIALLHKIFFHGAKPDKPHKATLDIHERTTRAEPLRAAILKDERLRALAYKHSPCDRRMHQLAQQLLQRHLDMFPGVVEEVTAQLEQLRRDPAEPQPLRQAALHLGGGR